MSKRKKLLSLFREQSFQVGDFILSSGKKTDFYINSKPILFNPYSLKLIGDLIHDKLLALNLKPDCIGGMEIGAIPISCVIGLRHNIEIFVIRKNGKVHGTKQTIEGNIKNSDNVIIVEDVITTGGSILKAIKAVENIGAKVIGIIALVDRGEEHLVEFDEYKNILHTIFSIDELKDKK